MTYTNQQALKDRQQLSRSYRASKHAQYQQAFEAEPRLRDFDAAIRRCGITDAEQMIALCRTHHAEWLRNADPETRALALEIVSRRIIQIRIHHHLAPIDDALPSEPDDVYQLCKRILTA